MSNSSPPALAPAGFSVPGSRGDAAPGSLLAQLRADAAHKREQQTVTIDLPPIGRTPLRATYAALGLDDLERYAAGTNVNTATLASNLEILARACRSIEGQDQEGDWYVLEDDAGPVTFDDRLHRLIGWERPDDEFVYPVAAVYEAVFDGNGFAVLQHSVKVMQGLGLIEEEAGLGESTSGPSTRSASPPHSA